MASHDLQEPLRMISVYSQLLERQYGNAGGDVRIFIGHIVGGARRMRDLLLDLLAYMEIATVPDNPAEAVDLNLLLEDVRQNLKVSIDESGAAISSDHLPTLNANVGHLTSLFQNLIGNSIKYRGSTRPQSR